ncbi:regulatory protein RecX [Prosthecodimorpha staleyi]|uniref:Regulatory protein RecX n=1 Tax=Prosthecodimorpha staleyi TaxID=2840188 RepID=A0A947DA65_9HYPH|nr:RecX family transcriptional regulator [Prosthecodimorpha staleyi]MBT9293184.1 RecX family transcriptional regulator [Prosthecodimorpha staleyi]
MTDEAVPGRAKAEMERLATYLRRAALAHCARYAATEADLARILERKALRRLALAAGEDPPDRSAVGAAVAETVAACRKLGLVDDRGYAELKVGSGRRRGLSSARLTETLAARGVDRGTIAETLAEEGTDDRRAALLFARRKRIGPWRRPSGEDDPAGADGADDETREDFDHRNRRRTADPRQRDLAILCRNGHPPNIARWVVGLDLESAETALRSNEGLEK